MKWPRKPPSAWVTHASTLWIDEKVSMKPRPRLQVLFALMLAAASLLLPGTALARTHVGDASNPQSFQIPWSSWPSDSTNQTGQTMSPNDADNANKNPFADNTIHLQRYKTHGMQGGYLQEADVALSPNTEFADDFKIFWLGSYYSTAQDASSQFQDAVHTLASAGLSGQSCLLDDQLDCRLYITPVLIYAVWSTQNGLAELAFNFNYSNTLRVRNRLGRDFQKLLTAADAALQTAVGSNTAPSPASPSTPIPQLSIGVGDITIYHDVNGHLLPTKTLRNKEVAVFVVAMHLSNFGTYSPAGDIKIYYPKGTMQLIQPLVPTDNNPATSKVIFDGTVDFAGQLSDGTPVAESNGIFQGESYFGPLTGVITLNLSTSSDTRTFTFTLKQRSLHCKKGYKLQQETCVKKGK